MFELTRIAESLATHLFRFQAKAIAHLIQPLVLEVAGKVREATASGMPMSNDDVQAFVETRLADMIKAEEAKFMADHAERMRQTADSSALGSASGKVPPSPMPPLHTSSPSTQDGPSQPDSTDKAQTQADPAANSAKNAGQAAEPAKADKAKK